MLLNERSRIESYGYVIGLQSNANSSHSGERHHVVEANLLGV
jgi:hypothetical protein